MKSFTDASGRAWNVAINVTTMRRVRDRTEVDLGAVYREGLAALSDLTADPVKLVDVIYVLCGDQAAAANVSDVQFGEAMAGDTLERATDALLEECVAFLPSRMRETAAGMLKKGKEVGEQLAAATLEEVSAFDAKAFVEGLRKKGEG